MVDWTPDAALPTRGRRALSLSLRRRKTSNGYRSRAESKAGDIAFAGRRKGGSYVTARSFPSGPRRADGSAAARLLISVVVWGSKQTCDRILECVSKRVYSAVSVVGHSSELVQRYEPMTRSEKDPSWNACRSWGCQMDALSRRPSLQRCPLCRWAHVAVCILVHRRPPRAWTGLQRQVTRASAGGHARKGGMTSFCSWALAPISG